MIYRSLLRQFSITDGLIRGTGLVNNVVLTAAFAILPSFGVHGLFIAGAIQCVTQGVLEIPFGWLADRFGWGKAVILSLALKCVVALSDLLAVYFAWHGKLEWAWACIVFESILDAFVHSLHNGAFEAAYIAWYRSKIVENGGDPSSAPPLFIRSLRFSIWIRLLLPIAVVGVVLSLQSFPNLEIVDAYVSSLIACSFIVIMRFVCFGRVCWDLVPLIGKESERIRRQSTQTAQEFFSTIWISIRNNLPSFTLYSLAVFQNGLSALYIAGVTMKQVQKLSVPEPYGWAVSVGLAISVYLFDAVFWWVFGFRIQKKNAALWIRNLGLILLGSCVLCSILHRLNSHPLAQTLSFVVCVFTGVVCAGAITRFFTSHIREWLKSDLVATWLSFAGSFATLMLGLLGALIPYLDHWFPSVSVLLAVSMILAVGIIYYLSSDSLKPAHQIVSLRSLLATSFIRISTLVSALVGVSIVYIYITNLSDQRTKEELRYVKNLEVIVARSDSASSLESESGELQLLLSGIEVCSPDPNDMSASYFEPCSRMRLAYKDYQIYSKTQDGKDIQFSVSFNRDKLLFYSILPIAFAIGLFSLSILILYQLLVGLSRKVQKELTLLLELAKSDACSRGDVYESFQIAEFKSIATRLEAIEGLHEQLTRHKMVADVSTRVAHDIRSPLLILRSLSPELTSLPESSRLLLKKAILRISGISNELLHVEKQLRKKISDLSTSGTSTDNKDCLVSQILNDTVSEMELIHQNLDSVRFKLELDSTTYGAFVRSNAEVLKCIVSNLVQNSVDSVQKHGEIRIVARRDGDWVTVSISDNGMGIPQSILASLLREKTTYNKVNGNGLALYNARRAIESWGGAIWIRSQVGIGTVVSFKLAKVSAPTWFVPHLEVEENQSICILDDDPTIHDLWRRRFEFITKRNSELKLVHFSECRDLIDWAHARQEDSAYMCLVDQELSNQDLTGLQVFEKMNRKIPSYLVTHYYEDRNVINECLKMGVGLMPKPFAEIVPIKIRSQK